MIFFIFFLCQEFCNTENTVKEIIKFKKFKTMKQNSACTADRDQTYSQFLARHVLVTMFLQFIIASIVINLFCTFHLKFTTPEKHRFGNLENRKLWALE